MVGPDTEPANTNKRAIPDADVLRNYYPGSDTDIKGRGKGEERHDSLKDIIDAFMSCKVIETTETLKSNPSEILGYNCVK